MFIKRKILINPPVTEHALKAANRIVQCPMCNAISCVANDDTSTVIDCVNNHSFAPVGNSVKITELINDAS